MANKKAPITVAGLKAKGQRSSAPKTTKKLQANPEKAYSFVSDRLGSKKNEGGFVLKSVTQVCEFAWHVPNDVRQLGAVGSARKYLSDVLFFLGQKVAER